MRDYLRDFTRGFNPLIRGKVRWSDLGKGPRELIDGWPWYTLTLEDIDALRSCCTIFGWFNTLTGESELDIVGYGRGKAVLPVPSRLNDPPRPRRHDLPFFCSFHEHHIAGITGETMTIVRFLRPGDAIRLLWWEDGQTTGVLEQAGLHHDFVRLEVRRDGIVEALALSARVTAGDSPLRMVRQFDPLREPGLAEPRDRKPD